MVLVLVAFSISALPGLRQEALASGHWTQSTTEFRCTPPEQRQFQRLQRCRDEHKPEAWRLALQPASRTSARLANQAAITDRATSRPPRWMVDAGLIALPPPINA